MTDQGPGKTTYKEMEECEEDGIRQRQHLSIERTVFTQPELDEEYDGVERMLKTPKERFQMIKERNEFSAMCLGNFILSFFPFIEIFKKYKPKKDIVPDIVAGLTVGIMQIPQGMAYAVLASVDPVYGLYMSFFPIIVYFFFGTSRHGSFGTFAVISLMVGAAVDKECAEEFVDSESGVIMSNGTIDGECAIKVATALTFIGGIMQMAMSFLHLGFVVIYLSEPMTRGFTTACSIHVFTSQMKYIFGVEVPRHNGAFKLVYTYRDLILALPNTNPAAVIGAVVCTAVLFAVKEYADPPVKRKIKAPIPIDLVVIILGTVASYYGNFDTKYDIEIIGNVTTGLPTPELPSSSYFSSTAIDAFVIAIVAYAISISMAQNFADKNGYTVDANQELFAHGIVNLVCSNFKCYMMCLSLSRSLVQESLGGVSQIAGLVAALLMLVVLLALASLFESLPYCVLAAIIVIALKGMFLQMKDIPKYWRISKTDLSVWLVTFLAVVLLDIDLGLLVGIVWSFLTVIGRTQRPYVCEMGRVGDTDMYGDTRNFKKAQEIPGVKIIRFESSLYFANRDYFISRVYHKARCHPKALERAIKKAYSNRTKAMGEGETDKIELSMHEIEATYPIPYAPMHHIILDCSTMAFLDSMGVAAIGNIIKEFHQVDVEVFLADMKPSIRELLETSGAHEKIQRSSLFPTVHDAVIASLEGKPEQKLILHIEATQSSPPSYSRHNISANLTPTSSTSRSEQGDSDYDIQEVVISGSDGVISQAFTHDEEDSPVDIEKSTQL